MWPGPCSLQLVKDRSGPRELIFVGDASFRRRLYVACVFEEDAFCGLEGRLLPGCLAGDNFCIAQFQHDGIGGGVELDPVLVFDQGDDAAEPGFGSDMSDHEAMSATA